MAADRFIDVIYAHDDTVKSLDYSPCSQFIIEGGYADSRIRIWDIRKTRCVHEQQGVSGVNCIKFSPDGKFWGVLGRDGKFSLYDAKNNDLITSQTFAPNAGFKFTPDNNYILAASSQGGRVLLFNIEKKTSLFVHKHNDYEVFSLDMSPDGRYIVSGGNDSIIKIYDMNESKEKTYLEGHKSTVTSLAFDPKSSKMFSSSDSGGKVICWDASCNGTNESLKNSFNCSPHSVNCLAYSPNGLILAAGSHDARIKIFSVEERYKRVEDLTGHQKHVYGLCFSPDGKFIATASADGTIRIWNVKKPHLIA